MYTARVFISSTFNDFTEERNILHREVFPRLENLCKQYGCAFHAIDLRWGISQEDSRDYTTLGICLNEIKRCMNETPRPNFIFLAGDRYGWQPLPDLIPAELFKRIIRSATEEERIILEKVYQKDSNALPEEYRLCFYYEAKEEAKILSILKRICNGLNISVEESEILFSSATHRELLERLKKNDFPKSAVCAIRTLKNVPESKTGVYYDELLEKEPDTNARSRAGNLKKLIKKLTPQVIEYEVDLDSPENERESALREFADQVYTQMEKYLLDEFRNAAYNRIHSEEIYHEQKMEDFKETFVEKESEITEIMSRLVPTGFLRIFRKPEMPFIIVTGENGSGKTALTALICDRYRRAGKNGLIRFIGLTGNSTDTDRLLENIKQSSAEKQAVFLDGVEKLNKPAKFLQTFVSEYKEQPVFLTMTDEIYRKNLKCFPEKHLHITKSKITDADAKSVLDKYMARSSRRLTSEQEEEILNCYRKSHDTYLLNALMERAINVRSFENAKVLTGAESFEHYVAEQLDALIDIMHLPAQLCKRMAAYILASRSGLSDQELLGILSMDPYVKEEFETSSLHDVPEGLSKLPYAYYSRTFYALKPLLTEFYSEGMRVYRFRKGASEDAAKYFSAEIDKKEMHSRIADYFSSETGTELLTAMLNILGKDGIESRYAYELPYQLEQSDRLEDLYQLLKDSVFMYLMHTWGYEEYIGYWAEVENKTEHTIPEAFEEIIQSAGDYQEGKEKLSANTRLQMIHLSDLMIGRGGYASYVDLLSKVRILNSETEGAGSTEVRQSKASQVQALLDIGQYDKAMELAEKIYREEDADNTVGYMSILNVYGQALYRKADYEKAKTIFTECREKAEKLQQKEHNKTALKWLASCEKASGNLDEALKLYEELEERFEEEGNLNDLIPIYFEQMTAAFINEKGGIDALERSKKLKELCRKAGNRAWMYQVCNIGLSMLGVQKKYDMFIREFPDYCDALIENDENPLLPLMQLANYTRAHFELNGMHHKEAFAPERMLRIIETYCLVERAGNLTLENLMNLPEGTATNGNADRYLYFSAYKYALSLYPECLRKVVEKRPADPMFFYEHMEKGVKALTPVLKIDEISIGAKAVYGENSDDAEMNRLCNGYAKFMTLVMYYGYSFVDQWRTGNNHNDIYSVSDLTVSCWNLSVLADMRMQSGSFFAEYRFRKTRHMNYLKTLQLDLQDKCAKLRAKDPIDFRFE